MEMRTGILGLGLLFLCPAWIQAADFVIYGVTDKDVAIYKPGEKIEFIFTILDGGKPVAGNTLKWERMGDDGKEVKGEIIVGAEGAKVTTSMDSPGFVRIKAKAFGPDGEPLQGFKGGWGKNKQGDIFFDGGACVDPEKLQPVKEPADFDAFWAGVKKSLADMPLKAELKELPAPKEGGKFFAVSLNCPGPKPVTGYLTYPANAKEKSLNAVVKFHGYGVREHNPPKGFSENAIVFDVNAHGLTLGDDAAFDAEKGKLKGYAFNKKENSKRDTAYFYGMSLRVLRALQYVKSLPQWNGKVLESNGGSQGGLQALWGAGQDPDVTSSQVWSPWSCDLGGVNLGRMTGWRPEYHSELDFYDPAFHVKRTTAKIHLIANYGDYTCPPSTVWVVYNNIPNDKKSMTVKQGCTHSYAMEKHMQFVIDPGGTSKVGFVK